MTETSAWATQSLALAAKWNAALDAFDKAPQAEDQDDYELWDVYTSAIDLFRHDLKWALADPEGFKQRNPMLVGVET